MLCEEAICGSIIDSSHVVVMEFEAISAIEE